MKQLEETSYRRMLYIHELPMYIKTHQQFTISFLEIKKIIRFACQQHPIRTNQQTIKNNSTRLQLSSNVM